MRRERIHANALLTGETGLLLRGASGSGKSALTLELITRAQERGDFAALIGDDRIELAACNGRLVARPHPAIAGLLEVRGVGVISAAHESAGVISMVVDLLERGDPLPDRLPDRAAMTTDLCGVTLPRLALLAWDSFAMGKIEAFIQEFVTK